MRIVPAVAACGLDQRQASKTHVQVALDGAQVDAKRIGQRLRVKRFALVELLQHLRQAIDQRVV